ncbi:gamma-glutamyltransferase [Verruconis gallopava]|uniref:Glutathione hydrolase n=1 Tax=Verruconis gallopava TaxID=253628 RepID=A0A0D2AR42_9PEZI|nr:gamma-glutamyltransferase [Verruconis gallopava]KIW01674.1 gamma-glutamyltransferase [Verruconis gallopava]
MYAFFGGSSSLPRHPRPSSSPSVLRFMAPLLAYLTSQLALSSPVSYGNAPKLGAVASENSLCSNIGIDLLKAGGNAADALVGTVFCVGVVGCYHSGIGGGGFMIVRAPNGTYQNIDFRETAPAAAFQDMYQGNVDGSIYGGLASGVPGELRGLQYLHENYGVLPWKQVVMPAVKVARYGWRVNEDLVKYMNSAMTGNADGRFLVDNPTWAIDFAPNGELLKLNETITRKRYADTLETIAEHGADAFYSGPIANATIAALRKQNGTMTLEDMQNYTVALRTPSVINYRGYKLTSCSAPASGVVALAVMNIVSGYDDMGDPAALNISTHRLDEAMRFGYGMRTNLGDPSFVENLADYENDMLSAETGKYIRSKIGDYSHNVSYYDPDGIESLATPGTSHVVVADRSGMAISLTTTVNLLFGSHLMVPETGVIMNNEMNDFSIPGVSNAFGYRPSPANYIKPGKRPLSSISPTIVEYPDGGLYFVVGAAGGSRITTATIQNLWHVLDQNMTSPEALAEPRLHDQLIPDTVSFEYAYNNATVQFMKDHGHNVSWVAPGASTAQALRLLPNGTFEAAGEPRQLNSGGYAI